MDGGGRAKHGARAEEFSGTFWLGPPRLSLATKPTAFSRITDPSGSDIHITGRLRDALKLVEVRLLDHCIISGGDFYSMAERGLV